MTGRKPPIAAPVPIPAKPYSVIGVSITRRSAEFGEQALRDFIRALIFGDFLAHHEHARIAAHFLGHRVAQCFAQGERGHAGASRDGGIGFG